MATRLFDKDGNAIMVETNAVQRHLEGGYTAANPADKPAPKPKASKSKAADE